MSAFIFGNSVWVWMGQRVRFARFRAPFHMEDSFRQEPSKVRCKVVVTTITKYAGKIQQNGCGEIGSSNFCDLRLAGHGLNPAFNQVPINLHVLSLTAPSVSICGNRSTEKMDGTLWSYGTSNAKTCCGQAFLNPCRTFFRCFGALPPFGIPLALGTLMCFCNLS